MTVSQSKPDIKTLQICPLQDTIFLATTVFIALSLSSFSHEIGLRNETLVAHISIQWDRPELKLRIQS